MTPATRTPQQRDRRFARVRRLTQTLLVGSGVVSAVFVVYLAGAAKPAVIVPTTVPAVPTTVPTTTSSSSESDDTPTTTPTTGSVTTPTSGSATTPTTVPVTTTTVCTTTPSGQVTCY